MHFITNYAITQSKNWRPTRNTPERTLTLHPRDREPSASVYFCRRDGEDDYREIGSKAFFQRMKGPITQEVVLFIHGFNNTPEGDVFPRAQALQQQLLEEKHRREQAESQAAKLHSTLQQELHLQTQHTSRSAPIHTKGIAEIGDMRRRLELMEVRARSRARARAQGF